MLRKLAQFCTSRMFIVFALIALQAYFFVWLAYAVEAHAVWGRSLAWGASLVVALMITRRHMNAGYKISWIIAVLAMPILGMTLYFFMRQRPLGRHQLERAQLLSEKVRPYLLQNPSVVRQMEDASRSGQVQSDFIYREAGYPLYEHTATTYYPSGEDFWRALLEDLERAEKYIFMEYFIIEEGVMLDAILEVLRKKVAQGVDVRLMYDDIGCANKVPTRYYETLRAMGIRCEVFNRLRPALDSRFNNRDHRKITVVDGKVGYVSGANLADEYINAVERFGRWKDSAVRLEGPGVWSLLVMFQSAWSFASEDPLDLAEYAPQEKWEGDELENGFVQPFSSSPLDRSSLAQRLYLNLIEKATKYVYINTPYLAIGDELVTALETAATAGVDVRITVPHIPDKKIVYDVAQSHFPDLIRAGARIYEYTPGFIHAKSCVCDDLYGFVGTVNLDYRSMYLNWECGVWMYGTSAISQMKADYLATCQISQEVGYAMTQDVSPLTALYRSIVQLFAPLL